MHKPTSYLIHKYLGRFENQKFSIFLQSQADLHVAHKNKASQYKILP